MNKLERATMDAPTMYALMVPGHGDLADPTTWGAWAHDGHRLWAFMSEDFWMYVYKVRKCPQPFRHDWTVCPYTHNGERVCRRDPRRFTYAAVNCPKYKAQAQLVAGGAPPSEGCQRGLNCRYAHGVFELWLHPSRFRTRMCDYGPRCPRPICFFAHFAAQLRGDSSMAAAPTVPVRSISLPPRLLLQCAPSPLATPPQEVVLPDELFDDLDLLPPPPPLLTDTLISSAATAAAAATAATAGAAAAATVPILMALQADGGEDSVVNDYPLAHLIQDML